MKIQSLLLVLMATGLAASCAGDFKKTERPYSILAEYPLAGPATRPVHPGTPVNCPGSGDADSCVIPITVTDSSCDADKIVLEDFVYLGNIHEKKKIIWKLVDPGYVFCPRAGDGVFLKSPKDYSDLFEPKPTAKCSDTFEWKRSKSDGQDYDYLLRFRTGLKICGVKDPWMRN
jgi:hypothetical protein